MLMTRTRRLSNSQAQDGFASLVIAIVLVLVLSLMTVGFAQLMQREQRQALDKQLSSQAYYAAESGVNDAAKAINDGYTATKNQCDNSLASVDPNHNQPAAALADLANNNVGSSTAAKYTCLLINPTPSGIVYNPVSTTDSTVVEIEGVDSLGNPKAIHTLTISWQDANGNTTFPTSCSSFPPAGSGAGEWSYTGLLRFQLIPIASLSRTNLINNTYTSFFCPRRGDTRSWVDAPYASAVGLANSGPVVAASCTKDPATRTDRKPYFCNAQITGLGALNEAAFFLDMRSLYGATAVSIAIYGSDGSPATATQLSIAGAQTLVDSTGKAQDVLRRIQVRIPAKNGYDIPDGTHGDLCKQLQLAPSDSNSSGICPLAP